MNSSWLDAAPVAEVLAPFPWQMRHWQRLADARRQDRLAHAYLLAGPSGVGKRAFAQRLAASLLCLEPDAEHLPCGRCAGCLLQRAGSHPDFNLLEPQPGKTQISIEAIRELCTALAHTAHQGRFRVAVIRPAEAMTPQSANSLLKTLEEPGAGVVLMLVSDRPLAIMPTLLSRCQRLDFSIPAEDQVRAWLGPRAGDTVLMQRLRVLSGGAPLQIREFLNGDVTQRLDRLAGEVTGILVGTADPLVVANRWAKEEPLELAGLWMARLGEEWARLCILAPSRFPVLLDGASSRIQNVVTRADIEDVLAYTTYVRRVRLWLSHGVANRLGLLESLLVPLATGLRDFRHQEPASQTI
ncbi:MAG: DNA polymerase III subunit delta' [Pseudomonadota bacterium]|nr:DNA polymerase III subunit delta' [Pseudomonadota bacterium]